jgi:hypothetical protein
VGAAAVPADLVLADRGRVAWQLDVLELVMLDRTIDRQLARGADEAAELGAGLRLGVRVGERLAAAEGEPAQRLQLRG